MASTKTYSISEVMDIVNDYMDPDDAIKVQKAYDWANEYHKDQKRKSGEPYIVHPIQVAGILADLKMDTPTVIGGFLHDIVEDTPATIEDVEERFGKTVANIIDGVTKINKIKYQSTREKLAENHRKLLLAMSQDIRVIIVKIADRLHNMRTLKALRPEKQQRIAQETLDIYAPLADRLGIQTMKWELEDIALSYLNPEQYHRIAGLMQMKRDQRISYVEEAVNEITAAIKELQIKDADVYGRPKHIYSIYKKMVNKNKQFSEIYDLAAIRVLTNTLPETYAVLGAIHAKWTPIPGRFKDYIALPKANGYQSLHTTVIGPSGRPLEVQIRTKEMHRIAEYGVAAHWAYKRGNFSGADINETEKKLNVIQGILELQADSKNAEDFMDSVQSDLFSDWVYAFTPRGDVFELTKGAGPLDMAFQIHSAVGAKTVGAKVNGKIVPLDYQIKTGDIVEILTSPNAKPSRDWLNVVSTRRARNKIKQYFKQQDREENIQAGLDLISQNLMQNDFVPADFMTPAKLDEVAEKLHFPKRQDMLAAIGFGDINAPGVVNKLTEEVRAKQQADNDEEFEKKVLTSSNNPEPLLTPVNKDKANDDVVIAGVDNLLVRLGRCCTPIPGDEITGYITKGRGVSVHRVDCPNIQSAEQTGQRIVKVQWDDPNGSKPNYCADLTVNGSNRKGFVNDILRMVNTHTKYVNSINGRIDHNLMAHVSLSIGVKNLEQLDRLINGINNIPDVYEVKRTYH